MNTRMKIYLAAAAIAAAAVIATAIWSHFRMAWLEDAAAQARTAAETQRQRADRLESETHIYKEKAAYLELQIEEVRAAARRKDEELKKLSADTDAARDAFRRARLGANKK